MSKFTRLTGVNAAKVMQVIEVKSIAGDGVEGSPSREVIEYYSFDGALLARHDSTQPNLELGIWVNTDE